MNSIPSALNLEKLTDCVILGVALVCFIFWYRKLSLRILAEEFECFNFLSALNCCFSTCFATYRTEKKLRSSAFIGGSSQSTTVTMKRPIDSGDRKRREFHHFDQCPRLVEPGNLSKKSYKHLTPIKND